MRLYAPYIAHTSRKVSHCIWCIIPLVCSYREVKGGVLLDMVTEILSCHHQEAACISSAITALLNLHRGSKFPPEKLTAPKALAGCYKVQNLTQKGYILMKLEEHNDLLHTWLFTEFLLFTELKLFGWLITKKNVEANTQTKAPTISTFQWQK